MASLDLRKYNNMLLGPEHIMDVTTKGMSFTRQWVRTSKGNRPLSFQPDIVVVHDLDGPEFARGEGIGEQVSWFEDLLVADYPDAHVLSFCLIADAIAETLLTGHSFQAQAWELLSSIQREREAKQRNKSNILFLASGVGLLIVEQALVIAHHVPRFRSISHQTTLVGFLETEASKGPETAWEELGLGAAVRFNQLYGWGIGTTLGHLSTALRHSHSAFAWIARRYKIITSAQKVALRAETATHEVLDQWQTLSSRIRRMLLPFPADYQKVSDEHGRDARNSVLSKLAPSHIHAPTSSVFSSQALKILEANETYRAWKDDDTPAILYVYGSGKMVLPPSLGTCSRQPVVTAYLSFADVPYYERTMSTVLKVLLFRTLCTIAPAFNIIQPIWKSFGQMPNHTVQQLWVLIGSLWLFPDLQSVHYMIDGIDQCECNIADQLEALVELARARGVRCKVLATSRTVNNAVSQKTPTMNLHPLLLRRENVKDTVWHTMRELMPQTRGLAGLENTIIDSLQQSMSPAELDIQLQALFHSLRPLTVCSVEENAPLLQRPLPELYAQLLTPLTALMPYLRTALSWMVLSFRPLSLQELAVAIAIYQGSLECKQISRHLPLSLGGDLTRALGPWVEIRNSRPMLVNDSITEFIRNELAAHLNSSTDPQDCGVLTHAHLTRHCLTYLKHMWMTQDSPVEGCYTSLKQCELDFMEYAAQYWPYHYRREDNKSVLVRDILDFLSEEKCPDAWAEWWRTAHSIDGTDSEKTPLALAAEHGLREVVHELITHTKDESALSHQKTKALEIALQFGHLDVARHLASGTIPSDEALVLASRAGDADLVKDILQKLQAPASACLKSLEEAAMCGHLQTIDALLRMIPDVSSALDSQSGVYLEAVRSGQTQALKHLLEARAAPLSAEVGSSLLHLAARRGDMDTIRLLQAEGYSIDGKGDGGMTILHHAADTGSAGVITELISSLDTAAVDDKGMSPLHLVCKNGNLAAFTAFLEANSLSLEAPNVDGNQPIHLAAAGGHLPVVVRLMDLGVDKTTPNRRGFTPLHLAAQGGHLAVVRELILREGDRQSVSKTAEEPVQLEIDETIIRHTKGPKAAGGHQETCDGDMSSNASAKEEDEDEEEQYSDGDDEPEAEAEAEDQDHAREPTPLHSASLRGYDDVVKELLEEHADCNYGNQHGSTPLHLAVHDGQTSIVKMLLDGGADPRLCDMDGRLPIHLASEGGNIFIFRALLQASPEVRAADDQGRTPLHISARHGYEELVVLLLERGADPNACNTEGQTALYCAIQSGNPQIVKRLLDGDARINDASQNQTVLIYEAVRAGQDKDVIRLLMEAGCNALAKGPNGNTSLTYALKVKDLTLVSQLLERVKPDIPSIAEYSESLFDLAQMGCPEGVKKVLEIEEVDVALKRGYSGKTALHTAAENEEEEIVRLLLERGADLNAQDSDGWTPLIYALENGHAGVVERLLNAGADPNIVVEESFVALHLAIASEKYDLVKLLFDRGASIPSATKDCPPILAWPLAVSSDQAFPTVELLLQHGASPFDIFEDLTVIEFALRENYQTSLSHLVQHAIPMLQDESDFIPLHLAAMSGNLELIEKYSSHSSNLGIKDKRHERTALHWAACTDHVKALQLLLDLGSDLSVQDKYGKTALHTSAERGKKDLVNAIIQNDDPCATIVDNHGWMPIHYAYARERTEIVPILSKISPPGILDAPSGSFPGRWVEKENGPTRHILTEDGLRVTTRGIEPKMRLQVRTDHPMPVGSYVYYYEVTVIRAATERILGFGFCEEDAEEGIMPGWRADSWGYHADDGHLYAETGRGKEFGPKYGDGDVVGCGLDFELQCGFFTCNGKVVGRFPCKMVGYCYPILGFGESGIELTTNFGPDEFCFKELGTYPWREKTCL